MAAVFAAAARAPLTAILIVFEMSNDYSMILPLMVATITAGYLAQALYPESIYTIKLTRRGIRFAQGRDLDIMQSVLVREVMNTEPITVNSNASIKDLYAMFEKTRHLGFPVVDDRGMLVGIVTLQDLENVLARKGTEATELRVADVAVSDPITVYADDPIWTAIQKMAPRDLGRLPVVSRNEPGRLIGLISRSDILRAYDVAMVRKQRGQLLTDHAVLRREKKNDFIEVRLRSGDHAIGRQLKDLELPREVNAVSVERDGELLIPKGDTTFAAGDVVTLFGRCDALQRAREILTGRNEEIKCQG
jgi:CIC family chloride channel protein